jgi:RHS repeat-associated protein
LIATLGYPTKDYHDIIGIGDFNGDGKDDILTKSKVADLWEVGLSTGKTFEGNEFKFQTGAEFQSHCDYGNPDQIFIADFNGDGKADILHERSYCSNFDDYNDKDDFNVYYLRGFGVGTSIQYDFQPYLLSTGRLSPNVNTLITDVDGDGKREFSFAKGSSYYLQNTYFNKGGQSHLLQKVTDGFNRTTEFQYKPLTAGTGSASFYTKGTGATYPITNGQYPSYVVTSMKSPDGIGGTNTANFTYENMLLHRTGRGLLGFQKVTTNALNAGIRTENTYDLNTDFYVSYPKTTKTFLNSTGTQLSQTDNTVSFNRIGTGYCFTQQATSTTAQDLLKGITTVSNSSYDANGNVTNTSSTSTGGPEAFSSSTATTFTATAGSAIPNKPSSSTVTSQRGSQSSVSNKMDISYDALGRVISSASYPGTKTALYAIVQNYTYDAYGNVLSSSKTANPSLIDPSLCPSTAYEYDTKGRFPIKETNPLGDISYKTYHKFWGNPLSATGVDGLIATFTYDNWGKLTSSYTPTSSTGGYTINYSDGWDISGNQLYYTLVQHPGAPDIKTWYDQLGRGIKIQKETFGSAWTTAVTTYDAKGNVATSTNNYLATETPVTTTNSYDALNRISSSTNVFGTTSYAYSLGSGMATTTVTEPDGKIKITTTDALGKVLKSSNGIAGTVHFTYDSRGNETSTAIGTTSGPIQSLITKQYDDWGRLTSMKDPDAGTTTYAYDAFGQLKGQTDPKGKFTFVTRDVMGRAIQKTLDGYTTNYTYYGATKGYQIQQTQVTGPEGTVTDAYDYNIGGTLKDATKTINGAVMAKHFAYDTYNNLTTTTYWPSNFSTLHTYDANSYLQTISSNASGTPKTLYQATSMNGNGQTTAYTRVDGQPATTDYYNGIVTGYHTPGIQDLTITYDYTNGNIMERNDHIAGTNETFTYDAIDRLTQSAPQKYTSPTATYIPINITYDNNFWGSLGRILAKTDAGTYNYGGMTTPVARNAVLSVTDPMTLISHADQNITYTAFHKANSITENVGSPATPYTQTFVYDANEDRAYSQQIQGGTTAIKRWYMGDYERAYNATSGMKDVHYISGPAGLCGIVVGNAGTGFSYYATYTDHLGSIVAVTNQSATIVARQSYDAWGRERNPDTWDYAMPLTTKPDWLYRGYTGHEMLPEFDLINMNGRMYDPINGRMMRPDNYVQAPLNAQSYNRYSYCWNNPMKYTDPSGDILLWATFSIGGDSRGGVNVSATGGVGLPGILSAQVTVGHDFGSGNTYVGVGGTASGVTATVGWGTQTGYTANVGVGLGFDGSGINSNITGAGVGWTQNGGAYTYALGMVVNENGEVSVDGSFSYSYAVAYSTVRLNGGPLVASNGSKPPYFDPQEGWILDNAEIVLHRWQYGVDAGNYAPYVPYIPEAYYHIPAAYGLSIPVVVNGITGFTFSFNVGIVNNQFHGWFTPGYSVGTPEASIGLGLFAGYYLGSEKPTFESYMGWSDNVSIPIPTIGSFNYSQSLDDNGNLMWRTYQINRTLSTNNMLPGNSANYSKTYSIPLW